MLAVQVVHGSNKIPDVNAVIMDIYLLLQQLLLLLLLPLLLLVLLVLLLQASNTRQVVAHSGHIYSRSQLVVYI